MNRSFVMLAALSLTLVVLTAWGCGDPTESGPVGETSAAPSPGQRPLFTEITAEIGLAPEGEPWPDGVYFLPEIMQGGVGLLDYDGDGDLDIAHTLLPPPGNPDAPAPNRLYRREADGTYVEVAAAAGLDDPGFGQGVAVGDVDNDGDPDVYFANYGPDAFYRNNGDGTFTRATSEAGFAGDRWSVSATFCDYDRDGYLDLFVAHYVRYDREAVCLDHTGRREYCGPQVFHGEPDLLYRNNGDGTFTDVSTAAGIVLPDGGERARGLGTVCADLTGDGLVDLYVANDAESNQMWVNRGDGTFVEQGVLRGVAVNRRGLPEASMGVAVGDADGDGAPDLFMTHLFQENNTLYLSSPGALYYDRTPESGLARHDWEATGFGCEFFDFDHDGDADLAVANGRVRRGERPARTEASAFWSDYAETSFLFENDGAAAFENVSDRAGSFGTRARVTRGLAVGDLDADGDLDMVTTGVDNSVQVFRNDAPPGGAHWLAVRAITRGRPALGAEVTVRRGSKRITGFVVGSTSYGSSKDPVAHFGLGASADVDEIVVRWPDGSREAFVADGVDREVRCAQGEGEPR